MTQTSDQPVLEVTGLRCAYGDFEAVRGIDLAVAPGELFALLGTNGAGKTTTMETIEGHRAPTSGSIRLLGLDPIADRRVLRPRLGIMLQETGFAGDLTVRETAEMWASLSTRSLAVDAALERLELSDRADTRVVQLSGGQKRRLDLVLATLNSPEVLFLDEPTAGLDPESRARTWEVVRELKKAGTTVILTTHYLEEAEELADRVAIMHEGRIAVEGTVAELVSQSPAGISFSLPGIERAELEHAVQSAVNPESMHVDGSRVRLNVRDMQTGLWQLLQWANEHGHVLDRIKATEASLAEVFANVSAASYPPSHPVSEQRVEENA